MARVEGRLSTPGGEKELRRVAAQLPADCVVQVVWYSSGTVDVRVVEADGRVSCDRTLGQHADDEMIVRALEECVEARRERGA